MARVNDNDFLQMMRDIGGGEHTACKLPVTISKGKATKGKQYVNRQKCVWCKEEGALSSVKCIECEMVLCYPIFNRDEVINSCFYDHVHEIKDIYMLLRNDDK